MSLSRAVLGPHGGIRADGHVADPANGVAADRCSVSENLHVPGALKMGLHGAWVIAKDVAIFAE